MIRLVAPEGSTLVGIEPPGAGLQHELVHGE
jgi:hypothetical protein